MNQKTKANEILARLGLLHLGALIMVFTVGLALLPPESLGLKAISPILGTYKFYLLLHLSYIYF